jgi:iron complex outermembrane recepter protein
MRKIFLIILSLVFAANIYAQNIAGTVTDNNGNPLSHANIVLDNGLRGTITDKNGKYLIKNIREGEHFITASFVGYKSETIYFTAPEKSVLNFKLSIDENITEEVVIVAKLENQSQILNVPSRINIINSQTIKSTPASHITNVFNKVSGVNVDSEFGMFSTGSSVTLRGINGGSQKGTLVVLNGSPINKSESGSVNWNMINKEEIESIEIVKGPGSVLYGSNAMGGIINIVTTKPKDIFSAQASLAFGTYNTLQTNLNLSGRSKNNLLYWKIGGSLNRSDGYINTPDEIIIENDSIVVPVYLKENVVSGEIGYRFNENSSISVSVNVYDDLRGTGIKIYEDIGAASQHDTYYGSIKYNWDYNKIKLFANLYILNEDYNRLNEYYSDGEYKLYEVDATRRDMGGRISVEMNPIKNLEIISGAEIKSGYSNGKDIYYTSTDLVSNRGQMHTLAGFLQADYSIFEDKLHLVPGIRYDYALLNDARFTIDFPSYAIEYLADYQFNDIENQAWSSFNPKFSIKYQSSKNSIYASVSRGFSAPILEDLCRTGRKFIGFKIANPELKPEYIINYEVGFDLFFNNILNFNLSAYYTEGKDFMYFLSTGDTVNLGYSLAPIYKTENISKVEIIGFEAEITSDFSEIISLYANYTFNSAVIKDFTPKTSADRDLTGKFLANIPMQKFSIGTIIKTKYVNLSIAGKYNGSRWINDYNSTDLVYLNSNKYPAYFITDLKIWKSIKNLTISFDVENVFDVIYLNSKAYLSPGRFCMIKLSYNFKYN